MEIGGFGVATLCGCEGVESVASTSSGGGS